MGWKRKLTVLLLLSVIITLFISSLALGAGGSSTEQDPAYQGLDINTAQPDSGSESLLNNSKTRQYYENNKPDYGERFISRIIMGPVKWIMNLFHLSDPVLLVFGKDPRTNTSDDFLAGGVYGDVPRDGLILGIFPEPFFKAVSILYTGFEKLLPIPLVIALLVIAIIHMLNSGTVEGRSKIKDYARAFIVAIVILRFGYYIWYGIIELNNFLVNLIWSYMMENGVRPGFLMDMIWGNGRTGFDEAVNIGALPMAILLLLAALMVLTLNYQYTMRIIILGLLIVIFPIAAALSVFPGFRHSLQTWAQEFVANVVVQLAHALALGGFFLALKMPGISSGVSFWLMVTYFAGLPAVAGLIRHLVGLQSEGGKFLSGVGAVMGLSVMSNLGRMLARNRTMKTAAEGNSVMDTGGSGITDKLTGASSLPGKGLQAAYNTVGGIMGSRVAKVAAGAALGTTAAMAGATLSTMVSGNPMSGTMAGVGAGSMLSRHAGRFVGSVGDHVKNIAETFSSGGGIKDIGENIMARSMETGGLLASAGWGLQSAVNKVSSAFGGNEVFAAPGYFRENRAIFSQAHQALKELKPQIETAYAKYNHALSHFGPENQETINLRDQYESLKGMYDTHSADALLARTRMKTYSELKRYASERMAGSGGSYSSSGGRI